MAAFAIPGALAVAGLLSSLFQKKPSATKIPTMGKQQIGAQNDILNFIRQQLKGGGITSRPEFQGASQFLQNLYQGGPEAFKTFEAPFMNQFNQEIAPGIARKYAGAGAGQGSNFQKALAAAGGNLSQNLAALRSGLQFQALPQALNFANAPIGQLQNLFQPAFASRFNTGLSPGGPGPLAQLVGPALGGLAQGFGSTYGQNLAGGLFGQPAATSQAQSPFNFGALSEQLFPGDFSGYLH